MPDSDFRSTFEEYVMVSSTIFQGPRTAAGVKSVFTGEERLAQTLSTIDSLTRVGYRDVLLLDNSGSRYQTLFSEKFPTAQVRTFDHYQYDNKGISETIMLLAGLDFAPADRPLMKLSGRYRLQRKVSFDHSRFDLAARVYRHPDRVVRHRHTMATRCYCIKNKDVYYRYLRGLCEEMYGYSARILGAGSLKRWLLNEFHPRSNTYSYFNPTLSVEAASMIVARKLGLRLQRLESIGLTGYGATFQSLAIED